MGVCVCVCVYTHMHVYVYILLHFRFWGTCAEHAGLLHRYTHAMVVVSCIHHPVIYIRYFS